MVQYLSKRVRKSWRRVINPTQMIVLAFMAIILIGASLLTLPIATQSGKSAGFLTALFTATSATCVTGLVVVDTNSYWNLFGQGVILALIQCGGLGFMSIATIFSFLVRRTITLRERIIMSQSLNTDEISGIVRLTKRVLIWTFMFEGIGALILSIRFARDFGIQGGIIRGVFHAVSAFCNAGFDLIGTEQNQFVSFTQYVNDPTVNFCIMALIIIGGLGFFVWGNIYHRRSFRKLEVQSKLALVLTAILLISGTILFLLFEWNNPETLGNLPWWQRIMAAMFQSTTTRTAGFNTISQGGMTVPSKFLSILLMFIGGSPGSTAGGIKTVTFAVLVLTAFGIMRGKNEINTFGRRIGTRQILNALTISFGMLTLVIGGVMVLTTVQNIPLVDAMFETASAIGTVGLTTGITTTLIPISKITLILLMFFGRVGFLTISLGLLLHQEKQVRIRYPVGKIMIG